MDHSPIRTLPGEALARVSASKRPVIIKGSHMVQSPLSEILARSHARIGAYGGVQTALQFGDIGSEFRELGSGCAMYDLAWRAKIEVTGTDRIRWLNGMVTN